VPLDWIEHAQLYQKLSARPEESGVEPNAIGRRSCRVGAPAIRMPTHEIDKLVDALQALRKKLQNAASRIQRDIAEHAELSEQVMQLTAIICGGVEKLPRGTH